MNITLSHAIKINTSPEAVYKALTDIDEMSAWHHSPVEGAIAVGSSMYLNYKSDTRFGWETKELIDNQKIVQTCIEGPGSSVGKTLSFTLSEVDTGITLVELTDGEWDSTDSHLPFCNTHWGGVLHNLKKYVEGK